MKYSVSVYHKLIRKHVLSKWSKWPTFISKYSLFCQSLMIPHFSEQPWHLDILTPLIAWAFLLHQSLRVSWSPEIKKRRTFAHQFFSKSFCICLAKNKNVLCFSKTPDICDTFHLNVKNYVNCSHFSSFGDKNVVLLGLKVCLTLIIFLHIGPTLDD